MKVVPEPEFYADFKNTFLNCRKWGHLCEKGLFVNPLSSFLSESRINMFFRIATILSGLPRHVGYQNERIYTRKKLKRDKISIHIFAT